MDLLPFFYARHDPAAAAEAAGAKRTARQAASSNELLQGQVDRLSLAVEALWTLLRDKTGITDEELRDRIREIDLLDGKLDGKVSRGPSRCPSCRRMVAKRHLRCIYCGVEIDAHPLGE